MSARLAAMALAVGLALPAAAIGSPRPDDATPGLAAVRTLAEGVANKLGERSGRTIAVPPVEAAGLTARRTVLFLRWRESYPWHGDAERAALAGLGLLSRGTDLDAALDALLPQDPGLVLDRAGRLLIPEELAAGPLEGDDPLLDSVGLSGLELRMLAELARASAAARLGPPGRDPRHADAGAARWCLAEAYARLVVLDFLLRAGGVSPADAGRGLLSLDTAPAVPQPDAALARRAPAALAAHLFDGPADGLRLLVHRLLTGGWEAVEAALVPEVPGVAALEPAYRERWTEPEAALALGPRHLRLALRDRGVAPGRAERLAAGLLADRITTPAARPEHRVWRLRFSGEAVAGALAGAWEGAEGSDPASGPRPPRAGLPSTSLTVAGERAFVTFRAPTP